MNEKTLVKTVRLREGRDWEWFADANIVGLAPHLDQAGRERALSEVQDHWWRDCLRVVSGDAVPVRNRVATIPNPMTRDVVETL